VHDALAIAGQVEVRSTQADRTHSARSLRAESCQEKTLAGATVAPDGRDRESAFCAKPAEIRTDSRVSP
jgi:hypothetical protein